MAMIAGVIRGDNRDLEPSALARMAGAVFGGGDGDPRTWREGPAGLLAAAGDDLSEGPAGSVMCFDGRLDNRDALLPLLGDEGRHLRSASDSALALALFTRIGERFLNELVGDFALAIWSRKARRLLCARSATGWRPLHWTVAGGGFAFASQPGALIDGHAASYSLNEGLLGEILSARFVSRTETPWQDLFRLAPGHALSFENGRVRRWRWYHERYEDLSHLSDGEHVERFNALFDQALISCMRSDRPVAAQLSGGLDSSSVVCRVTELHRAGRAPGPIGAISARYPGQPHDETHWSAVVEEHLGITARAVGDAPYDIDANRVWCAETRHLPVRPNALGPTLAACRLMQGLGERVLLTGEGGDDWMNGTRAHWPDLLRQGRIGSLLREGFAPETGRGLLSVTRGLIAESAGPIVSAKRRRRLLQPLLDADSPVPPLLRPEWAARIDLSERWREAVRGAERPGFALYRRSLAMAPPHRELMFDPLQASASRHGVELRHPFHDLRLIRFFMGAAGNMLLRNGQRKHLLREAMRGTLPEAIRTRQSKAHFAAPVIDTIDRYFAQRPPADLLTVRMGWSDGKVIARLFDEHRRWRREGLGGQAPNPFLNGLWYCVAADMWLEHAFGLRA
ncbi:MAG TPA: asparagine synthase-related protein [Sphingomonas sp.]|nr:asparagine synthase-related protein [Sphingomonas sp.]